MKPPPAWKFDAWKLSVMITMMARTGTAAFQITVTVLPSESSLAPSRLMIVNSSIAAEAISRPVPFSVPLFLAPWCSRRRCSRAQCVLSR